MHKLLKKALHSDNLVCTFMRSIASSQAASWVDMGVRFALFAGSAFCRSWQLL